MKTLRGTITHSGDGSNVIPSGATVTVEVRDCTLACAPSKLLGSAVIPNVSSFPFDYEVKYDESKVNINISYGFTVGCSIEKNDRLEFISDTLFSIIDDGQLKDRVDFHVVHCPHFD